MTDEKNKKKSPFPPSNVSVHYYTDPIYSTDAFYGYEGSSDEQKSDNLKDDEESHDEALDEPVESWGWINNVD